MKNIFTPAVTTEIIHRIEKLTPDSKALWGKMSVSQMLAHCNVTYEYVYEEEKFQKPGSFKKFLLKLFVKNSVVNDKPYGKNSPTSPDFIMPDNKNFEAEKTRLINYIKKTQEHGENFFDNKESHSFGKLTKKEWNNLFYKHLDHHLGQFGV